MHMDDIANCEVCGARWIFGSNLVITDKVVNDPSRFPSCSGRYIQRKRGLLEVFEYVCSPGNNDET